MALFTPAASLWHADVVPYISVGDYLRAPTSVDVSELAVGQDEATNLVELSNAIRRGSAWANQICDQVLAATIDTETASGLLVKRDGRVRVVNTYWPMLELDSFSAGASPSSMTALTNGADIFMEGRKVLSVPVVGLGGLSTSDFGACALWIGSRAFCQWTYWNGWPHSTLAEAAEQGAEEIVVTTALPSATAGQQLTISDGEAQEVITVASTFTGGTTVALSAPLVNAHTPPAAPDSIIVTALPEPARAAVVSLTSACVKVRGTLADTMDALSDGPPRKEALIESGGLEDYQVAVDLLDWFRRAT